MNKMIPTKWRYLAELCRENRDPDNYDLAIKIDKLLLKLGYQATTQIWDEDYEKGIIDNLRFQVVNEPKYCTACEETEAMDCEGCRFKAHHGNELYHRFIRNRHNFPR